MKHFAKHFILAGVCCAVVAEPLRAMNCETQFVDMTPHYASAKEAVDSWLNTSTSKRSVSVLSAIGANGLPKINVKSLEKDGKVLLGFKSDGQEPVLAIYRFDASIEGSDFRLVELRQKSGGNQEVVISEMPVDKTTGQLFPEVEAHPAVAAIRKNLQLRFGPEVTSYIRETGEWFDFATAKDLRDLTNHSNPSAALTMLHMRMRGRWVKEVLSKDLLKQVFRGVLLGGVVFGSSYLAQKFSESDEKAQKSILDSMAALLLIELANLEADGKVQIPDSERDQIVRSALSISKHSGSKSPEGEVLKLSQVEVASTTNSLSGPARGTEKFWVLDRLSGRIFVGLAEASYDIRMKSPKGESPRLELNTRALVEISASEMPVTYKTALAKFKHEMKQKSSNQVSEKVDGK